MPNFFPKLLPASPVGLDPTCPPCFTWPLPSFLLLVCFICFPQRPSCPKFRLQGLYCLCSMPAFPVGLELICLPRFTGPLPSFLLLVCFICFPQRPSCPKFRLRGLYNLCPLPTLPSARKPTCPRICLDSAPFFLPIFCPNFIFCRFRVVFGFKFQALFSSLLRNCKLFLSPLPLFSFLFFPSSLVVRKNYPVHNAFTWPLPSFLRFACIVRFPQRPSCPKFRLRGLYNLCSLPTSPSARKPTCPSICLSFASFFLPIFCPNSIFYRFRVVFRF